MWNRNDFPFLKQHVHGHPIVYLDNAATSQKPQQVLDAIMNFYKTCNANVHRGLYHHAECATQQYEQARAVVAQYIGAAVNEIVFTKGATESINLVATAFASHVLKAGDEIIVTQLEHHANLLPWYALQQKLGIAVNMVTISKEGSISPDIIAQALTPKTKLVAITHTSHVTGVHLPVADIAQVVHSHGAYLLVDAAQSIVHQKISVSSLGADFLVFSGHKMLGPTGIGVLFVSASLHDRFVPYQWGGGMVTNVQIPFTTLQLFPHFLEAGTPAIAQAVGLAAAVKYLQQQDIGSQQLHEAEMCNQLTRGVQDIRGVSLVGPVQELQKSGHLVSFFVRDVHAHDIAAQLDTFGIAVRAGNHCAQPLVQALGNHPLVRVSLLGYNNIKEISFFLEKLEQVIHHLA